MIRALDDLPSPEVADGYRAHSMEKGDLGRRVEVHRAAFAPSRVVVESYRAVTQAFPYRAALDQVVESSDGTYVAFALGWLDADNRVGELEPVGTHPDHRRKGLAAAVSLAALHALARRRREDRLVYSNGGSEPRESTSASASRASRDTCASSGPNSRTAGTHRAAATPIHPRGRHGVGNNTAKGQFEVTDWDEKPYAQIGEGGKLTKASVKGKLSGDIVGEALTEWLMCYASKDEATFRLPEDRRHAVWKKAPSSSR